jgi:hypothetical protein
VGDKSKEDRIISDIRIMPTPTLTPEHESSAAAKQRIFELEGTKFCDDFNVNSFLFSHNLATNPLFELPRLTELAESLLKRQGPQTLRWKNSDSPVDAKWAQLPPSEQIANVSEAIQNLDKSGSWVVLYSVQGDPAYSALFEQALDELEELSGQPLRDEITWKECYIFMGSPHAVTPYHIDHETTFLMQIHGNRMAHLWDQKDRSVLTAPEIENYYMGELGGATYLDENQKKAYVYEMDAGKGVHHPGLAPHYYKNGDTYSVAMGIHLCLKNSDRLARAHQVNACLRKFGIQPTPVGRSPGRDRLKINALSLLDQKNPTSKFDLIRSGAMRLKRGLKVFDKLKGK